MLNFSLDYFFCVYFGETTTSRVLNVTGPNAIVDWVLVELRYKLIPTITIATISALVQRDGDIVGVDGLNPPTIPGNILWDDFYVVLRHRNHLGIMSAAPLNFQSGINTTIDFSAAGVGTFGNNALMTTSGLMAMWPGNGNFDGNVTYQGSGSDILPITQAVFSNPLNTAFQLSMPYVSYEQGDYNMDGSVIYQGSGSDILSVTQTVFTHPLNTSFQLTFPIVEQLP